MRWLIAVALAITPGAAVAADDAPKQDVAAYLADGFVIAGKQEETHTLPGKPPYADRQRVVQVTTYDLERGGDRITCEVIYDSQKETISTACQ